MWVGGLGGWGFRVGIGVTRLRGTLKSAQLLGGGGGGGKGWTLIRDLRGSECLRDVEDTSLETRNPPEAPNLGMCPRQDAGGQALVQAPVALGFRARGWREGFPGISGV